VGKAQVHSAAEASILATTRGEPGHDAGALAAEVKRQPLPVPDIGLGFARYREVFAVEAIRPERATAPTDAAVTGGRRFRRAFEAPAHRAAVTGSVHHPF